MQPNVLLIILDAARARNLQLYGHCNETTPFLDSFAEEATVYNQARSPSTWSLPSHTSMFTGLEVAEHNIVSRQESLAPGHTVWETLRDEMGYETGVFSENPFITSDSYGLARGFDEVVTGLANRCYPFSSATNPNQFIADDGREDDYVGYLRYALASGRPVRSTVNALVRQLELIAPASVPELLSTKAGNKSIAYASAFLDWQEGRSTWGACLNFTDVHHPYIPTEEHNRWGGDQLQEIHDSLIDPRWDFYSGREPWWKRKALESLYDGCLHQTDATIEHIIRTLRERGQLDDTLVVITGDHGEGFGEPSFVREGFRIVGHAGGIHELLLHVPLVVKRPRQESGDAVTDVATLTRFADVVVDTVDDERQSGGFVPDGPVVATSDVDRQYEFALKNFDAYRKELDTSMFTGLARAVYRNRPDGAVRKYVQWEDDERTVDIFNAQNAVPRRTDENAALEVENTFDQFVDAGVRVSSDSFDNVDDETKRRLENLGYM
jgi:arylsulfatase